MNKTSKQQRGPSPLLFLVISLIFSFSIHAQEANHNKPLAIGDRIPELELRNVINHSDSVIRSEEWEGKLVILSFWATWCTVCIEQLPKMEALQAEFVDQILILQVTKDPAIKVQRLLETSQVLKGNALPFVTDTDLSHLFPYRTVPHEVWIDFSGRVVAITGHEEVNRDNIRRLLENQQLTLGAKVDIMDFDHRKPFIAGGLGSYKMPPENIKYSRMITTYVPGVSGFQSNVNKFDDRVTIKCANTMLQDLYVHAIATNPHDIWPQNLDFYLRYGGRLVWEAKDSTLFYSLERRNAFNAVPMSQKAFNYEIILPRIDSASINKLMLKDLNDYFGYHYNIVGNREKRMINCWVLICVDSTKLLSKAEKKRIRVDKNAQRIQISKATIDEFLFWWLNSSINTYYQSIPIINETGISRVIDLDLEVDPSNFEAVKKAISAYGLEFRLERRLLDMIIISNNN